MSSQPRRGLSAALAITAAGWLLFGLLKAWRSPPEHFAGVALLLGWGLALGVLGWLLRPGWHARAVGVGGLAAAGLVLNLCWLPAMHAAAHAAPLELRPPGDLLARTLSSWHPLISTKSIYLALGRLVAGREVRWVPSEGIAARRLLSLSDASRLTELPEPGDWVPAPEIWSERYETLFVDLDTEQDGRIVEHRFVGISEGAAAAEWFVVLEREGVILAIPDRVWEAERRRARQRP